MALNCFFSAIAFGRCPSASWRCDSAKPQFQTLRVVPAARAKYAHCSGVASSLMQCDSSNLCILVQCSFQLQYQQLTTMLVRQVFKPFVAKTRQAIAVRQHQYAYLAPDDCIGQFEQATALEIESTADFFHIFDIRQTTGCAELFQDPALIPQIGLLRSARHSAVRDDSVWCLRDCSPILSEVCASPYRRRPVGRRASGENVPQRSQRCSILGVTPSLRAAALVVSMVISHACLCRFRYRNCHLSSAPSPAQPY